MLFSKSEVLNQECNVHECSERLEVGICPDQDLVFSPCVNVQLKRKSRADCSRRWRYFTHERQSVYRLKADSLEQREPMTQIDTDDIHEVARNTCFSNQEQHSSESEKEIELWVEVHRGASGYRRGAPGLQLDTTDVTMVTWVIPLEKDGQRRQGKKGHDPTNDIFVQAPKPETLWKRTLRRQQRIRNDDDTTETPKPRLPRICAFTIAPNAAMPSEVALSLFLSLARWYFPLLAEPKVRRASYALDTLAKKSCGASVWAWGLFPLVRPTLE